ncbi:MAG: hybrid sensor histidine kinase/response regulator [Candidatus Schekmanbacteria bacterium]|nr:hybrid sensor histidine kinase/response regulator [Candidatus Schekmanbacteria bacterium]
MLEQIASLTSLVFSAALATTFAKAALWRPGAVWSWVFAAAFALATVASGCEALGLSAALGRSIWVAAYILLAAALWRGENPLRSDVVGPPGAGDGPAARPGMVKRAAGAAAVIAAAPLLHGAGFAEPGSEAIGPGLGALCALASVAPAGLVFVRAEKWGQEWKTDRSRLPPPPLLFACAIGLLPIAELMGVALRSYTARQVLLAASTVAALAVMAAFGQFPMRRKLHVRLDCVTAAAAVSLIIPVVVASASANIGPTPVVVGVVIALAVAGLGLSLGVDHLYRPIELLSKATAPLRHGSLMQVPVFDTADEIGEIGRSLQIMVNAVDRNRADLEAQIRELQEAERLREEFLANVSHELRTPLTIILGNTELLLEGMLGELSPDQQEFFQDVYNQALQLKQLITDVLEYSRLERKEAELHCETFNLSEVVSETVERFSSLAKQREIRTKTLLPEVKVRADRTKLGQVAHHLLSNAYKFTPKGGVVRVAVEEREGGPQGGFCRFIVQDTGIGIPKDKVPLIFERFRQLDGSATREVGGVGVGLTIAKAYVDLHGGAITVDSEVGKGSRFVVTIPLRGGTPDDTLDTASFAGTFTRAGGGILAICESDTSLARLLATYAAQSGYNPVTFHSGQELFAELNRLAPVAVVLNPLLRDQAPWKVLGGLREMPGAGRIPLVLVCTTDEVPTGTKIGPRTARLVYPFSRKRFVQALERAAKKDAAVS